MKKCLIVNDSPKDIFSEYLMGTGWDVTRQSLFQSLKLQSGEPTPALDLVLVVNLAPEDGVKMKKIFPEVRVVVVSGGVKSFSSLLAIVYDSYDYDWFSYSDFSHFEKIITTFEQRPLKLLQHVRSGAHDSYYRLNPEISFSDSPSYETRQNLAEFVGINTFLSECAIIWLTTWAKEIEAKFFPLQFSELPDKKISRFVVPLKNNHRGLPIFKDGNQITLWGDDDAEASYRCSVVQASDGEILVSILGELNGDKLIPRSHIRGAALQEMKYFRIQAQFLSIKMKSVSNYLKYFQALLSGTNFLKSGGSNSPAEFLAACWRQKNYNYSYLNFERQICFDRQTEKILRDASQVRALVNIFYNPQLFNFVIGPAGTGKTFTAAVAIQQLVRIGKTILVVSHSNLGVDNLVEEVAKYIPAGKIFRLGNDASCISEAAQPFHNLALSKKAFFPKSSLNESTNKSELNLLKKMVADKQGLVLFCTLDSYHSLEVFANKPKAGLPIKPHITIVDESSRGLLYDYFPIILNTLEKIVFFGDTMQLGNISPSSALTAYLQEQLKKLPVNSFPGQFKLKRSPEEYFNHGFFNSVMELGYFESDFLNCNRRSLTNICFLISQVFYGGKLLCGRFNPYDAGKIVFLDTKNNPKFKDAKSRGATSYHNRAEAALVVSQFVGQAVSYLREDSKHRIQDLVIISPYMAQLRLIKAKLRKHLLYHPVLQQQVNPQNVDKILDQLCISVDAIQGGQRNLVFLSLVVDNDEFRVGFNNDIRRFDVALSRARNTLIITGNSRPFLGCEYPEIASAFDSTIKIIKARGVYRLIK